MTTIKRSTKLRLENVWDHCENKLIVKVMGARQLGPEAGHDSKSLYVKVHYAGTTCRTKRVKTKNLNHVVWEEFFYFEPNGTPMHLEVWDSRIFSDDFFGTVTIDSPESFGSDQIVDKLYPLDAVPVGSKKPHNNISGSLEVRMYYSNQPETRPPRNLNPTFQFNLDEHLPSMKSGDLILYSGIGLIPTLVKLDANPPAFFSSVGIVLRLPNKWTEKEEVYVFEVTRNIDHFRDLLTDEPRNGPCMFRLDERVHQFHGLDIYWLPLKKTLLQDELEGLVDAVLGVHAQADPLTTPLPNTRVRAFIHDKFNPGKNKFLLTDLYAPGVISHVLRAGGILSESFVSFSSSLNEYSNYGPPVVLRRPLDPTAAAAEQKKHASNPRVTRMSMYYDATKTVDLVNAELVDSDDEDVEPEEAEEPLSAAPAPLPAVPTVATADTNFQPLPITPYQQQAYPQQQPQPQPQPQPVEHGYVAAPYQPPGFPPHFPTPGAVQAYPNAAFAPPAYAIPPQTYPQYVHPMPQTMPYPVEQPARTSLGALMQPTDGSHTPLEESPTASPVVSRAERLDPFANWAKDGGDLPAVVPAAAPSQHPKNSTADVSRPGGLLPPAAPRYLHCSDAAIVPIV
eukprot:CAMPEP_0177688800 /NCGR_PEP_ID=MMETSP0447-20121125/34840_1 /TAXON_ID=0 /ORGANISM="Stygamoeba regulata, Strain BSH-02190019" /LENGTH=621 /DNA_ID=CAMNT_0019199103 /DNA_START=34 /DNA_END=1896 /DNA_ORIENTATION=-